MKNIWQTLRQKRPFFALAPMDDVTDTVFREIVARTAAADVSFTEFAATDGFVHPGGRASVEKRLHVTETEAEAGMPVIAQIWGSNPDHYYQTARELAGRGIFAGIDINLGCPEKGIVKRGCCGGLIREDRREVVSQIIQATKDGAGGLPISVKTRLGLDRVITEQWSGHLLKQGIDALAIHARTVREMSRVPARWGEIAKVVQLRDQVSPTTVIIGNGDVDNRQHGEQLADQSGVDGIMIGRGVLRDIGAFSATAIEVEPSARVNLLLDHLNLYEKTWAGSKPYDPMKKFAKLYISGFPGAADLRARLMETKSPDEAREILSELKAVRWLSRASWPLEPLRQSRRQDQQPCRVRSA